MNDTALIATIEGYASVYNARDLNGDIVAPGAFAKSLKQNPAVRMLYSHDAEQPIGRWTSFKEDTHGLFVTGEILLSSPRAREIHALLSGGALDGLSIGYQTVKAKRTALGRRILEASLWEVSVVTFPMAPGARVTKVGAPTASSSRTPRASSLAGFNTQTSSVCHFADALRDAASILTVQGVVK